MQYHHYRRRERDQKGLAEEISVVEEQEEEKAPRNRLEGWDLDVVWERLEPIVAAERLGRPYAYARRAVLDAIVHVRETNCGWRGLPKSYPPWQVVYAQLRRWQRTGTWDTIWVGFPQPFPTSHLQL